MQNLYSDQSYHTVDRQLKRRLVLLFAVLAVLLGIFVWDWRSLPPVWRAVSPSSLRICSVPRWCTTAVWSVPR